MSLPPAITDNTVTAMPSWVSTPNTYYGYCTIADVLNLFTDAGTMQTVTDHNLIARAITESACELYGHLDTAFIMTNYVPVDLRTKARLNSINARWAASLVCKLVFGSQDPNRSRLAEEWMTEAHLATLSLLHGEERIDNSDQTNPYGDATARPGVLPVPAKSQLARNAPDSSTTPIFSTTDRPRFDPGRQM
jgi:hypothetical protein